MTDKKQEIKIEQGNGEVDIDITKQGIHIQLTNTPKWTYILIGIGLMFLFTFIGHAIFSYYKGKAVDSVADKIVDNKPLTDADVRFIEGLSTSEKTKLKEDVNRKLRIETDGMSVEQTVAPGTKVTIEKDGKKTSITKGGD